MNQEIAGTFLGYGSQVNHSVCLGSPPPADWAAAAEHCLEVFHSLVDWIEPGKSVKDFSDVYRQKVEERGLGGYWGVVFHTGGAGDGPRVGPTREEGSDLLLKAGMVFTIKPRIPLRDTSPTAQFGDAVVVTEEGARRLGKRTLEVINLRA